MTVIGIDPGTTESAGVVLRNGVPVDGIYTDNTSVIQWMRTFNPHNTTMCIETIQAMGLPVGQETLTTALWCGRIFQAWLDMGGSKPELVFRKQVKLHFCGSLKAKDAHIRAVLIDRFGGKEKAIGKKKTPGPLYHVRNHLWSGLAIALFVSDTLIPQKTYNN